MTPTRHVSAAIKQLRFWVGVTACVVALSAGARLVTFGFVHYTDLRTTEIDLALGVDSIDEDEPASLEVVTEETRRNRSQASKLAARGHQRSIVGVAGPEEPETPTVIDAPHPEEDEPATGTAASGFADALAFMGAASAATGVLATFLLAGVTCMGLVIAAGGSVPGVEKTVTASVWAAFLALLCIPWRAVLPAVPLDGVFRPYTDMVIESDTVSATGSGELALLFSYVGLPGVVIALAPIVLLWFRAGVEAGVLVADDSEVDERLEKEMEEVRRRLSVGSVSRSSTALNQTMDTEPQVSKPAAPIPSAPTPPPPPPAAAAPATDEDEEALAFLRRRTTDDSDAPSIGRPMPGDGMRRPI